MNTRDISILAAMAIAVTACKKDEEAPPANNGGTPTTGTIRLAIGFTHGENTFDFGSIYQDGAGNSIRFSTLKFYLSNIHLEDDASNTVGHYENAYLLVDGEAATNVFTLGTLEPVGIHGAHFNIGLVSEVNHADPITASFPLNVPGMHWSWNPASGYKFLNMEGRVDGNGDGDLDDAEDGTFTYHCATDALLREKELHVHANVTAGGTATLEAKVDVAVLLSGLDLRANGVAMGGGANNVTAVDSLVAAISAHH